MREVASLAKNSVEDQTRQSKLALSKQQSLESLKSKTSKKQRLKKHPSMAKTNNAQSMPMTEDHKKKPPYLENNNQNQRLGGKPGSKNNFVQKKQSKTKYLSNGDKTSQNQMKHSSVYTDKATVLQAMSPSAGPTVTRKKQLEGRFPSSTRVKNNYSPDGDKQFTAQAGSFSQEEGLPQIVSPNQKIENRTHHTASLMTASSQLKFQQMPAQAEQPPLPIMQQSNTYSGFSTIQKVRLQSLNKQKNDNMRNGASPLNTIPDQSTQSFETRNASFQHKKKSMQVKTLQDVEESVSSTKGLFASPGQRLSEQITGKDNKARWTHVKRKTSTTELSPVSPKNFKLAASKHHVPVQSQKHSSMKRQHTNGEARRQVYHDYTVDKTGNSQQYVNVPAIPKSRGRDHRDFLQHEMLHDPSVPGCIYKSTRSAARRTGNGSTQMNASLNSVNKGFSNQIQNMPYNVSLKGPPNLKGAGTGKSSKSNKFATRTKQITPMSPALLSHNNGPVGDTPVSHPNVKSQNVNLNSLERTNSGTQDKLRSSHQLQDRPHINQTTKLTTEENRENKMPSLTKQNLLAKNQTSLSMTRAGAARFNRQDHNSLVHDQVINEIQAAQKIYNSRSRVRHPSIVPGKDTDCNSLQMLPGTKPSTVKGTNSQQRHEHMYLSKNVSRVKKRLDVVERDQKGINRNNSQLQSRTNDEKQSVGQTRTSHTVVLDKLNQCSHSKPTMGEKTTRVTDDDSQEHEQNSGGPSPVIEEKESPSNQKQRRFSTQSSPRNLRAPQAQTGPIRKSMVPTVDTKAKKQISGQQEMSNLQSNTKRSGRGSNPPTSMLESTRVREMKSEKRLKNSETCPDHLQPTLGQPKQSHAKLPIAPQSKSNGRRNITMKATADACDRKQQQNQHHSAGLRKSTSHDQSMARLPSRAKQQAQDPNKRQEMQQKVQLIQLRNFRSLIDGRRRKNPDQQPLDLREFQIGLQVGQGAFAIVRRGTHKETKHIIAIKTYDKKNLTDKETQMAVHREINTLSDLWHPNIMKLHEVIDQRTQVHLVMEMCSGSSIYHHIKKQPDQRLPEEACQHIFKQVVRGVAYMHSRGYAHRDLKLDNILMDFATKNIKIIDFGFSQRIRTDEKLSIFCGTPHYMDPDIVKKSPYNPLAADVWACGVILYIIYVGKLPFFGEFEGDLFRKIQLGKFTQIPTDLRDDKIKNIFKRIFDVNASTRITAQQLLEHPWIRDTDLGAEHEQEVLREQQQQLRHPQADKVITADNA